MNRIIGLSFSCVFFLFFIAACANETDCYSENTSYINLEFYQLNIDDPDTSFYERDSVFVLRAFAVGNEGNLFISRDTIKFSTQLPVNPTVDTTTFIIGNETLKVKYDIRQRVLSAECGVEQVFSNLDTLSSSFDSLAIKSRNLDSNEINFEIYSN